MLSASTFVKYKVRAYRAVHEAEHAQAAGPWDQVLPRMVVTLSLSTLWLWFVKAIIIARHACCGLFVQPDGQPLDNAPRGGGSMNGLFQASGVSA